MYISLQILCDEDQIKQQFINKPDQLIEKAKQEYQNEVQSNPENDELMMFVANDISDEITIPVIQYILDKAKIKVLNLVHAGGLDVVRFDKLIPALSNEQTLDKLILTGNKIGDKGVEILVKILKANVGIKQCEIGNNKISDIGAATLAQFLKTDKKLEELTLDFNNITNAAFLLENNLVRISVESNKIEELNDVPKLPYAECIDFSGNPIKKVAESVLAYCHDHDIIIDLRDTSIKNISLKGENELYGEEFGV